MDDIRDDIREIKSDITEIKIIMTRNTESLEHHIKRTDLLEKKTDSIEFLSEAIEKDVVGIKTAYATTMKIGAIIASGIGLVFALLEILKKS